MGKQWLTLFFWAPKSLQIDCSHEIKDQSWVFTGRTDVEAQTPVLWPPDTNSWLIWKDPDAGKDWRQEKQATEDEMVGWHHRLNGHECEQTPGDGEGQGSLVCCSSWGCKESDTTGWLNNHRGLNNRYLFSHSSGGWKSEVTVGSLWSLPSLQMAVFSPIFAQSFLCVCLSKFPLLIKTPDIYTHSSTLAWKIPWMEEPGKL